MHLPLQATANAGSSFGGDAGGSPAVREVLDARQRSKIDLSDDRVFYSAPRLVQHLDARFRAQLAQLYRERIPEGADILDLCRCGGCTARQEGPPGASSSSLRWGPAQAVEHAWAGSGACNTCKRECRRSGVLASLLGTPPAQ